MDDFVIFGSGPLLAHGLIETVADIDLVARGLAWQKARGLGALEAAPDGDGVVRLGDLDIFGGWLGMDVDALIGRAERRYGLPWADLQDVRTFKEKLRRPKDDLHLRLLQDHLDDR